MTDTIDERKETSDWQCYNCNKDVEHPSYAYCSVCDAKIINQLRSENSEKDSVIKEMRNQYEKLNNCHNKDYDEIQTLRKSVGDASKEMSSKDLELGHLRAENSDLIKQGLDYESRRCVVCQSLAMENGVCKLCELRAELAEIRKHNRFRWKQEADALRIENEKLKKVWNVPLKAECGVCHKDCSDGSIGIFYPELGCEIKFCSVECCEKIGLKIKEISDLHEKLKQNRCECGERLICPQLYEKGRSRYLEELKQKISNFRDEKERLESDKKILVENRRVLVSALEKCGEKIITLKEEIGLLRKTIADCDTFEKDKKIIGLEKKYSESITERMKLLNEMIKKDKELEQLKENDMGIRHKDTG